MRGFTSLHPFVLFVYYFCAIVYVMYFQEIGFLLIVCVTIILIHYSLDKGQTFKKWILPLFFMALFIIVLTPIFNHIGRTILFTLIKWPITLEAVLQGVIFSLTLVNIIALFVSLNLVLTNEKVLYLAGRIFPRWALLTMLSLRFIPLLRSRLTEIREVQQFTGEYSQRLGFRGKINQAMNKLQILLSWSLETSIQTADSMDARAYGVGKRSHYHQYNFYFIDWLILTLFLITAGLFVAVLLGQVVLSNLLIRIIVLANFIIPIVLFVKEELRWKLYSLTK